MVVSKEFCTSKPKVDQDFEPIHIPFVVVFKKKKIENKGTYSLISFQLKKKICILIERMLQNITTLLSYFSIGGYFYKCNVFISKTIFIGIIDKTKWRIG